MREIQRRRNTGEYTIYPFLAIGVSGMTWIMYGALASDMLVLGVNTVAAAMGVYYTRVYLQHGTGSLHDKIMVVLACLTPLAIAGSTVWSLPANASLASQADTVGTYALLLTLVSFAAPLVTIRDVVARESAAAIPTPIAISQTLQCIAWFIYGRQQEDVFIIIPNVLGAILGAIQLSLIARYGRDPPPVLPKHSRPFGSPGERRRQGFTPSF